MSTYDFYVFDLDGTLCDTLPDIARALNAALAERQLPQRTLAEVRSYLGEGARDLVYRASGAAESQLDTLVERYRAHYRMSLIANTRFYDGVVDTLAARATPAAVLTNKPGTVARRILDALGIRERFTAVVGDGDGFPRKPDPTSLRSLITTAGAKRPLYVGDSHVDAETASRAGIEFVFVEYGYGAALGDFRRIARFADLP